MKKFLDLGRAISDESRVRSLMALAQGELCLCQLIDLLQLAPSTVSKHMSQLHQVGLVERRKEGRWHFYRLAGEEAPEEIQRILQWMLESLVEDPMTLRDRQRLEAICSKDLVELSECYRS